MKILIDNQVFESQKFGGISRYFDMLQKDNDAIKKMQLYRDKTLKKKGYYQKIQSKLNRSSARVKEIVNSKHEFYNAQINNLQFDIFHPTYYNNYFLDQLTKPFVLTVHDMIHEKFPEFFECKQDSFNKRILCEKATKIIAVSNNTKKDLIEIFGIQEEKIKVIYHGTNFHKISDIKPPINITNQKYLLYTGNRRYYKNFLSFLIAIAPFILEKGTINLICTGPNFTRHEIEWIKQLGLESKVLHCYCENDKELAYLYKNAECFVFPSQYEGFGLPILEAFACDCPVVCSSGGSLKEIGGNAAVYFDPKNILDIRKSIEEVVSSNSLKKKLVESGKIRLKNFSWLKCRKETMKLYSEII